MSQILPRFNQRQERAERERKIARIILEAGPEETPATVARATLAGDARRLRGLPAIGRGVGGTIPGTSPEGALLAAEGRRMQRHSI